MKTAEKTGIMYGNKEMEEKETFKIGYHRSVSSNQSKQSASLIPLAKTKFEPIYILFKKSVELKWKIKYRLQGS